MSDAGTVVVVTRDGVLRELSERLLKGVCDVVFFCGVQSSIDFIYNCIPNLLVVDMEGDDGLSASVLNGLKSDPLFCRLPVLAVFGDSEALPRWEDLLVEDYVRRGRLREELSHRVALGMQRSERIVDINPLTRLPGNTAIMKQVQRRLAVGEAFGLAYADLDFFKPFNDKYGFSRGDEVLKMVGRLVLNTVLAAQPQGSFVGHVGGDDFVYIMDLRVIEETSGAIIRHLAEIVPTFYEPEDRLSGFIESVDREGRQRVFPLMSISIGIAHNGERHFEHYGEMAEAASEMKKYAKTVNGSACRMDRRLGAVAAPGVPSS